MLKSKTDFMVRKPTYDFTIVVVKSTKKQSNRAVFCILGGL